MASNRPVGRFGNPDTLAEMRPESAKAKDEQIGSDVRRWSLTLKVPICAGIALMAFVLAACGSEARPDANPVGLSVLDSAGIQIVESTAPRYPEGLQYRVAAGPSLTIGDIDDPGQIIGALQDALRLSDGRILVLDRMTQGILVFGPDGQRTATWGGRGEGPGEFGLAVALVRLDGDSVAVPDLTMRRTTVLDAAGHVIRTFSNEFDFNPRDGNLIPAQSCCIPVGAVSSDLLVWRYPQVWPREGSGRRDVHTTVVRSTSMGTDTLGTFLAGTAGEWPDGTNPVVPERFGPSIGTSIIDGGRLVIGAGRTYGYDVVDVRSGDVLRRVRAVKARRPVTPEIVQEQDEWEAERREGTSAEPLRQLARRPVADSIAAFSTLHATPSGEVWLREYEPPPIDRSMYQVFSAEGEWLGQLELPGGGVVVDLSDSHLLRWVRGELDESLIEVWRIGPVE